MDWTFERAGTPAWGSGAITAATAALALLDEVECGLIVCDVDGRTRVANHSARLELAAARLLEHAGDSVRRVAGATGDLEAAMTQAAQRHLRCMVRLRKLDDELLVTVSPLQLPDVSGTHVLLMLGRREPCSDLALEMLAGSYGLTLAERRVLAGLLREATPREIADENGVSLCTVRTQVAAIRNKFGARSIEALLLRVTQVPPACGALRMNRSPGGNVQAPLAWRPAA